MKLGRLVVNVLLCSELFFQGNLQDQFFHSHKRYIFAKIKKPAFTNMTLLSLKFISRWIRCVVKILEDFTEGNSRFSQMKP